MVLVEPRGETDKVGDVSRGTMKEDHGSAGARSGNPPPGEGDVVGGAKFNGLIIKLEGVRGLGNLGGGVVDEMVFKAPEGDEGGNGEESGQQEGQEKEKAKAPEEGCQFFVHKLRKEEKKAVDKGVGLATGGVVDGLPRGQGGGTFTG